MWNDVATDGRFRASEGASWKLSSTGDRRISDGSAALATHFVKRSLQARLTSAFVARRGTLVLLAAQHLVAPMLTLMSIDANAPIRTAAGLASMSSAGEQLPAYPLAHDLWYGRLLTINRQDDEC